MKKRFSIIFGSIFTLSVAYSSENTIEQTNLFIQSKRCPNNIYFGPEAFVFDLKTQDILLEELSINNKLRPRSI